MGNSNRSCPFLKQTEIQIVKERIEGGANEKAYRYYTDNSNVAKVSKKSVITAKAKGRCLVYVLTNNGVYRKIKVTVK